MVELFRKDDNAALGVISDDEFQFLVDNLEEESLGDEDYTLDKLTLEFLRGNGMSAHLFQLLSAALGERDEVEVRYAKK
jgi:processive 1,2-diacylglycerol beta-glucosyltransferase